MERLNYVPEPQPAKTDRLVMAHYYPGWTPGGTDLHNGFADLADFPERTPLLGYYDEADPETTDWEIKWALEHGIGGFIYCWYRYRSNLGKPVTRDALRLGHALHDGLFRARYGGMMKFAIMWECQTHRWGSAVSVDDIVDNILPFWIENYFSRPNYLRVGGKPILFIYAEDQLAAELGSPELLREAFARCDEIMKEKGLGGLLYAAMENCRDEDMKQFGQTGKEDLVNAARYFDWGFDYCFQYTWPYLRPWMKPDELEVYNRTLRVPPEKVIGSQLARIRNRAEKYPGRYIYTNSVMRDSAPWYTVMGVDPRGWTSQWRLDPGQWKELMTRTKSYLDSTLPEDDIGRKICILDTWNEWSEGHYISPHRQYGFQFLDAVREVYSDCANVPDHRSPAEVGLGPYDGPWKRYWEKRK